MQMKVMVFFETWEKLMTRIVLHVEQVGLNPLLEMWHNRKYQPHAVNTFSLHMHTKLNLY